MQATQENIKQQSQKANDIYYQYALPLMHLPEVTEGGIVPTPHARCWCLAESEI